MSIRTDVLKLYKTLIRHTNNLVYTDKVYYKKRIRRSFKENKNEKDPERIGFLLEVIIKNLFAESVLA